MQTRTGITYQDFQRWRRPVGIAALVLLVLVNTVFNGVVARIDNARLPGWEPWVWEGSSALLILLLIPMVLLALRRWPLQRGRWVGNLARHLVASVAFSLCHVAGMVAVRKLAYAAMGQRYQFGAWWPGERGAWWPDFGYEYLKDIRTYFFIIALVMLWRLVLMRWQGEARLLAEPDEGPPVEPVDRPERFLVRKLGKEFLVNASEIEWLQAAGNYVNLHVRGRDYPLRATMAGIEGRLDPARFVRVHRSYAVNLDYLAEIEPLDTGDARLHLRDGATIPCSRRYRGALRERFGQPAPAA